MGTVRRAVGAIAWVVLAAACGGDGDGGEGDAGPPICPRGIPEVGTGCRDVGVCTYAGMTRECPPLVGTCTCVDGAWACAPPECTTCRESCNGECCDLDWVCRAGEGGLGLTCAPPGDGTAATFGPCGHPSDCAGVRPVCSPICGDLCCTFACDAADQCDSGHCDNHVCAP